MNHFLSVFLSNVIQAAIPAAIASFTTMWVMNRKQAKQEKVRHLSIAERQHGIVHRPLTYYCCTGFGGRNYLYKLEKGILYRAMRNGHWTESRFSGHLESMKDFYRRAYQISASDARLTGDCCPEPSQAD